MYSIQEQYKTDALAQMNGRVRNAQLVADNILDLSREIGVLNIRTTKASAEQFTGAVRKLLGASNPAEFMQIATSAMQPDMQLWTSYIEQLRSIAGKAGAPVTTSLTLSASTLLAPQPAVNAASEAEAPAVPEQLQLEAAIEPAPEVPSSPAVPQAAPVAESSEEAPQPAAATPPAVAEAISEVAEAMTGANKSPAVVMAASALPLEEPAVPEITVVRKTEVSPPASKQAAAPVSKKAAPARGASNRGRKG